jgi:hypothetical protein
MKSDWCNIPVSLPWRGSDHFRDLRIWLLDNIDECDWDFDGSDPKNQENRIYYFAKKQDATTFSLRWL